MRHARRSSLRRPPRHLRESIAKKRPFSCLKPYADLAKAMGDLHRVCTEWHKASAEAAKNFGYRS